MIVKKKKDLKNNTYKQFSADLKSGGFCIDFTEPFEDYSQIVQFFEDGCFVNVKYEQFTKDEIDIDKNGVWRPQKE